MNTKLSASVRVWSATTGSGTPDGIERSHDLPLIEERHVGGGGPAQRVLQQRV